MFSLPWQLARGKSQFIRQTAGGFRSIGTEIVTNNLDPQIVQPALMDKAITRIVNRESNGDAQDESDLCE
jgi:hypothetical protein